MSLLVLMIAAWGISGDSTAFAQLNMAQNDSHSTSHQHEGHQHGSTDRDMEDMHVMTYDVPETFKNQLDDVYQAYFHIQFALSHDNAEGAKNGAEHLARALSGVDMKLLTGDAHMAWMKEMGAIRETGKTIAESNSIDTARSAFIPMSQAMITLTRSFGTSGNTGVYQFHCPMAADNKGADWLQSKSDIENPFYGSSMFKCGNLVETFEEAQ